ncbi:MAG: Bug family tripartite tricarboxylate transporter substrate binding protein [Betaproteobacteria bacterium]
MISRQLLLAAVLFSAAAAYGQAQPFPSKSIRLVLPFPTGSGFVIGQVLSEGLRDTFKHGVVSEPRPGAGGSLALEAVARAAPDGHTLLVASPILTISPIVRPSLKLDPLRDFAPITLVGTIANLMVVHPTVPAKNIKDFVKQARAHGGTLTYGSSGQGSTNHLVTELFSILAKVKLTQVPYKSATFAVLDLVRGDVDLVIGAKTSVAQFIPTGKLRVIAVLGTKREPDLPDVPTGIEQGMPELVAVNYYGVLAPGGTPAEIIDRLHREIIRVSKSPEARRAYEKAELDLVLNTPAQFVDFIKQDTARWKRVVREANVKLE